MRCNFVSLKFQNTKFEPMPYVRLFTSGTHSSVNGKLSFSNEDVQKILDGTQSKDFEAIPFVLGHPKNNLPIVGWLPKSKIKIYTEGDKVSLGFERDDAELSDESMKVIRDLGSNKISVRLEDGGIRHIGLVTKAAVEENNAQNFSQSDLSGIFQTSEDILETKTDFQKMQDWFKTIDFKSFFKPNSNMAEKEKEPVQNADLAALIEQNKELAKTVGTLQQTVTGFIGKTKATADFSADEYKHLSAAQKETAAGIIADLGEEKATALKGLLKELAKQPVVVKNGSVTKDFGAPGGEKLETVADIVREQMKNA